jgi:excisionase family DNA binding protein
VTDEPAQHRFLTPTQVADELNVKPNQVHALIKTGELRAFQIGGRRYLGQIFGSGEFWLEFRLFGRNGNEWFVCGS